MTDERALIKAQLGAGKLQDYVEAHCHSPHPYLAEIRAHCLEHKWNFMLTTPDQAAFLYSQTRLIQAKKILEVGSYYGHSTLALAAALPSDGKLIAIEHNPKFVAIAKAHMIAAGVANRIEFRTGEAHDILHDIDLTYGPESFDLIFIDADKRKNELYWEIGLKLLRDNGLIIFDNALARGDILNHAENAPGHIASVRHLNSLAMNDPRVFAYIATLADGMLVAVKQKSL